MLDSGDILTLGMAATSETGHVNKPATMRLLKAGLALAIDLAELHKATGISLDNWDSARIFVEAFTGEPVVPNGA